MNTRCGCEFGTAAAGVTVCVRVPGSYDGPPFGNGTKRNSAAESFGPASEPTAPVHETFFSLLNAFAIDSFSAST